MMPEIILISLNFMILEEVQCQFSDHRGKRQIKMVKSSAIIMSIVVKDSKQFMLNNSVLL